MFLITTLGALAVMLALVLTPLVRDYLGKWGFLDHPDGVRKKHATPIPRVGGIAIVLSYVTTFVIALALPFTYTARLHSAVSEILPLTLVGFVVFLTGVLDDLVGLAAWQKLAGIAGASVLAYFAGIHVDIHLLQSFHVWPGFGFVITVLWLIGCTNAFNLIDGVDGLAVGVGLVAALTMLIAALMQSNLPLALATMPLAGCLLGFLRYNFNGASVFLGDGGSLLIGFMLGCYGALWSEKSVTLVALLVPLLAVSVPLIDVLLSIVRRFLRNRPIFEADHGHIHHRLQDLGLSPRNTVLTLYGISAVVAVFSLLAGALHNQFSGLIMILFGGAVWFGVRQLDYAEFAAASRMFLGGRFRRIIDVETRTAAFEASLTNAISVEDCWTQIRAGSESFGFHEVRMSLCGRMFTDAYSGPAKPRWQLRISLPDSQWVNFYRNFDSEMNPLALNAFVSAVQRGLARSTVQDTNSSRRPPASERHHTAAAGQSSA